LTVNQTKPVVVYLHRYPPESEALQWPALRALAEALAPTHELVYCCMGPGDGQRDAGIRRTMQVIELPFTVNQADGRDKWIKTLRWYRHLRCLLVRIRALRPAVIICKETLPFIPGRIAALGIPTIIETSDWWWSILLGGTTPGRWLADRLEEHEVRSWNKPHVRATVSTHAEGRLLERRGLAADNIVVINAPQNPSVFRPIDPRPTKADLGLDERHTHVAIFGIIRAGKGYDQLLDWWKIAVARHPDWRLVIIGGAGGEAWCRREIAKRHLEHFVHMTGWLSTKEEVNKWLNAMDVLLAHRRNSPDNQGIIPSALFNGLSTGRPVVASGLPGMAEIVRDGIDGVLFTPDDGESFLAAIERLVSDPVASRQIGRSGMERAAECFDPIRTAISHVALIATLAGKRRDAAGRFGFDRGSARAQA
jgi:glycosyltransferase involved in cell wall biosynthesis